MESPEFVLSQLFIDYQSHFFIVVIYQGKGVNPASLSLD